MPFGNGIVDVGNNNSGETCTYNWDQITFTDWAGEEYIQKIKNSMEEAAPSLHAELTIRHNGTKTTEEI